MADVKVYIYDLSRGMARAMSRAFLGKQIDGIWHTGIVVFGKEYFYGGMGGIECCAPGGTIMGQPDTIHHLGQTQIPYDMFIDYLADLSRSSFRPSKYHLLEHNCNTFSSELAQFLTGNDIPGHITGLPAEVLSTPFGQMIKPMIDSMSVQPSGGQALFPEAVNNNSTQQTQSKAQPSGGPSQPQNQKSASAQSHAQGAAKPGADSSLKFDVMIFKEEIPDRGLWSKPEFNLTKIEQAQLTEVYEYLTQGDDSWSLCKDHMTTLYRLVTEHETDSATCVLQILCRLVLKEDIMQMLTHDKSSQLPSLLEFFDTARDVVKMGILKLLTNICSTDLGHRLLLGERYEKLVVSVCVNCLVNDSHKDVMDATLACCYNLAMKKLNDDVSLELGSALLNCVEKVQEEAAGFHLMASIYHLIRCNEEVRGLASVLGINFDELREKSDRMKKLYDRLQNLL